MESKLRRHDTWATTSASLWQFGRRRTKAYSTSTTQKLRRHVLGKDGQTTREFPEHTKVPKAAATGGAEDEGKEKTEKECKKKGKR